MKETKPLALPKSLKSGTFILAKAVIRCRLKIQRSGKERIVTTPDQPQQSRLGVPSRADLHGKPDEPPDGTGPFRCLRSVNARAARCGVLMVPIVLTACQPAVLDPQ